MITQGKWVVIDSGGRVMLEAVGEPQIICTLETRPLKITPEVKDNARLIATAPKLLATCQELASIFPEKSMSEMDAADFTDRANRIWVASQSAKNAIEKAGKGD